MIIFILKANKDITLIFYYMIQMVTITSFPFSTLIYIPILLFAANQGE